MLWAVHPNAPAHLLSGGHEGQLSSAAGPGRHLRALCMALNEIIHVPQYICRGAGNCFPAGAVAADGGLIVVRWKKERPQDEWWRNSRRRIWNNTDNPLWLREIGSDRTDFWCFLSLLVSEWNLINQSVLFILIRAGSPIESSTCYFLTIGKTNVSFFWGKMQHSS